MSKEYIIELLALCASNIEYVRRDIHQSPQADLLKSVEETLNLLGIAIDSNTID